MNKTKINYFVDFIGLVAFLVVATTGFWRWLFLPSGGVGRGVDPSIVDFRRTLILWHDWGSVVLTIVIILHFVLHWKWIVCMTKTFFGKK